MTLADLPKIKWWVFFLPAKKHYRWWYKLVPSYRGAFQHIFALCELQPNIMQCVESKDNILVLSLQGGRPTQDIEKIQRLGGRVLFVEFEQGRPDLEHVKQRRALFITCASVIGYCLGLDTRAVTPRGIHDVLLAQYGATEVENVRRWRKQFTEQEA